ncbi:MAG: MFS transporter [Candidatus Puniceispirillaceae bacterium]
MNALTHPGFISYFLTNTLSLLGIWILKVGMGWLAWQITQSTFWTSVVSLLLMAPVGFLGPFIAVFVERWDARRAMLATKILMVVITTAIFVIQILGQHNLWTLVGSSTALGLLSAFQHPVRLVFISLVVPRPYLASAVGLNSVSWNLSRILGPGHAGRTIHFIGLSPPFLVAAAFNVPLIACLYFLALQPRSADSKENSGFMKRMIDGGTVVLRTPLIFSTLILVSLNSFFVRGILEIQPAIVGQIMGGKSYDLAIVTAAAGLGSLLASGWIGLGKLEKWQIQKSLWPMLVTGIVTSALLHLFVGLTPVSVIFIVTGFTATIVGIGAQTLIQLEVQESYRARVMTWWSTISFGSLFLGGTMAGFLGDIVGMNYAILCMMLAAGTLALSVLPRVKALTSSNPV